MFRRDDRPHQANRAFSLVFAAFFVLNFFLILAGASGAVPFGEIA